MGVPVGRDIGGWGVKFVCASLMNMSEHRLSAHKTTWLEYLYNGDVNRHKTAVGLLYHVIYYMYTKLVNCELNNSKGPENGKMVI